MSGRASLRRPLRDRSFRALWLSLAASSLGDWAARLALTILVLDRTHSAALSSLVVALSFVPWLGPGQVLATRLGHLPRIPVMVGADVVRAVIFALLLLPVPWWAVLGLVLVAAVATPPFEAARSALTIEVVPAEDYGSAVALLDMTDQAAIVAGYLVGGLSVVVGGVATALVVDVASFVLSAVVLSRVHRRVATRAASTPVTSQLRRGVLVMLQDPVIRRGTGVVLLAAMPAAAIEATVVPYARWVLHADADVVGLLAAAVPVGIILTVPLLPRTGTARRLLRVAASVAVLAGALGSVAFGAGHLAGALVGYLAAGVLSAGCTPAQIAFQPRIPTDDRLAVFSVAQGLVMGVQALGAVCGGVLATAFDPRRADVGWMLLVVVGAVLAVAVPVGRSGGATGPGSGTDDLGDGTDPGRPTRRGVPVDD